MTVAEWGIRAALTGGLLALAAHAIDRPLALFKAPRRWVWVAGLLASIAIPIIGATRAVPARGPAQPMTAISVTAANGSGAGASSHSNGGASSVSAGLLALRSYLALPIVRAETWVRSVVPSGLELEEQSGMLIAAWLAASLALLVLLVGAARRTSDARKHWRPAQPQGVPVLVSEHVGPAVVGVTRPHIVLPQWTLALDPARLGMILMHEREHIASRDMVVLAIGCVCLVAMPWNPAIWYFVWLLRERIELDCDRRVLSLGVPARSYGDVLLQVATARRASMLPALALSSAPTLLEQRLKAMKTGSKRNRATTVSLAALGATLLVVLACDTSRPAATERGSASPQFAVVAGANRSSGGTSILLRRADGPLVPGVFQGDTTLLARISEGTAALPGDHELHVLTASHAQAREVPLGSTVSQGPWLFIMVRRADGNLAPGIWRGPARLMQRLSGSTGIISDSLPRVYELVPRTLREISITGGADGEGSPVKIAQARTTSRPSRSFVPARAVIARDGRPLVFVVRDGRAQWVYIQRGPTVGDETEVLANRESGQIPIKDGDSVVVEGHLTLTHGAPVRIIADEFAGR